MSQIFYEVLMEKRASADTTTLVKELDAMSHKLEDMYARRKSIHRGNFLYPAVGVAGLAIPAAIYSRRKAGERAKGESEEDYNARRSAQTGKYVRPAAIAGGLIGGGINMYRGSKFNAEVPQINEALRALQARVPYLPPDDVSNAVERLNATIRKNR